MKILYDQQIFSFQNYGGISRYFYELISRVGKTKNKVLVDGKFSNNIYLSKLKKGVNGFLSRLNIPYKNVLNFYANLFLDSSYLKSGDFDILHATYFHPYFLSMLHGMSFVVTVHDMIPELFPSEFKGTKKILDYKKKVILRADYVISVSENTKKDLINLYGVSGDKIKVVYHGNPLDNVKPSEINDLPDKYLLFVGNRVGYKNFTFFLESISPILRRDKSLFLVCAGGGPFSASEKIFLSKLKIEKKVIQTGFKDDSELAYIYKNALVYVLPSLYEGFGLTALEAFSMGCPVVASNTSSIPEVCGEAAFYVDPRDKNSIEQGIISVLNDRNLRDDLVNLGFRQVKNFSWERTVKETLEVYKKILNRV